MRRAKGGFTLIETAVSVTLAAVGIVAVIHALGTMSHNDHLITDRERLQRLAVQKYDELIATGALANASQSGDFKDRNIEDIEWKADVIPSGVTNLDQIRVVVSDSDPSGNGASAEIDGLRYNPPATTSTAATGAGR